MKKKISKELLKGSLKPIILKLLKEQGRMYGYQITQKVEELSDGKISLTFGALYPILHKLEAENVVVTEREIFNNRSRVYYKLTDHGNKRTSEILDELEEYLVTMRILLNSKPNATICTT